MAKTDRPQLPSDSPLVVPFLKGWRREVVQRQTGGGSDAYYFGPSGKKYRSIPEILRAVGPDGKECDPTLGRENFSFSKNVLGYENSELDIFRSANIKGRPSAVSESPPPKKAKLTKAPDPPKKKQTARKTMPTPIKAEEIVCEPVLCDEGRLSGGPSTRVPQRFLFVPSPRVIRAESRPQSLQQDLDGIATIAPADEIDEGNSPLSTTSESDVT